MKRGQNNTYWWGVILFLFIGLGMGFISVKDYFGLKNAKDITELKESDFKKGTYLHGETDVVIDYFCYEKKDNVETYRWYLIPVGDMLSGKYISVKVNAKLFKNYDAVCQSTYDFIDGKASGLTKAITFQGELKPFNNELKRNLKSYMKAAGESAEKAEDDVYPFYIQLETTKKSFTNMIISGVFLALGILLLVVGRASTKRNEKNVEQFYMQSSQTVWNGPSSFTLNDNDINGISYTDSASKPAEQEGQDVQDNQ